MTPRSEVPDYGFASLVPGDAMGAMVPLRNLSNLNEPGEYSVLVSLPTHFEGEPDWVAEPIKVRVEPRPSEPKK